MKRLLPILALLIVFSCTQAFAFKQMTSGQDPALDEKPTKDPKLLIPNEFPTVGEQQVLKLIGVKKPTRVSFQVIYRPNSETSITRELGRFSPSGKISWIPENPGITTLNANGPDKETITSMNVATKFASTPVSGVVVFFLAGFLLFGGAIYSLRNALKS